MAFLRQVRASTLLSILLVSALLYQFGAYDPGHDQNHARHCCAACHAGHIAATSVAAAVTIVPPSTSCWNAPVQLSERAADPIASSGSSRAPPA